MFKLLILGAVIYFIYRLQSQRQINAAANKEDNGEEFVDYEEIDDE